MRKVFSEAYLIIILSLSGSNWVPGDAFLTTITPERYRSWLQLMKDGNQNMVRLWGGGVYEPDIFYEICDGKLVHRPPFETN